MAELNLSNISFNKFIFKAFVRCFFSYRQDSHGGVRVLPVLKLRMCSKTDKREQKLLCW